MSIEHEQPQFSSITYTREYVNFLDYYIKTNQVISQELIPVEGMSNEKKVKFYEMIESLKPLYERLHELVPIFLYITQNKDATERLITLKHIFHDQVELLKQNKYIMTLENLYRLRKQFIGYFVYVRNAVEKRQCQEKELSDQFNQLNI